MRTRRGAKRETAAMAVNAKDLRGRAITSRSQALLIPVLKNYALAFVSRAPSLDTVEAHGHGQGKGGARA